MYYDRQGNRIDRQVWGALFADEDYKVVRRTNIDENVNVSTVWLGLDHSFGGDGPLIFETMVFGGKHDQHCNRYRTQEEAVQGHEGIVEWLTGDTQNVSPRELRRVKRAAQKLLRELS